MNGSNSPRSTHSRASAPTLRHTSSFNDGRHPRRQTCPAVFPRGSDGSPLLRGVSSEDIHASLELLEHNYDELKKTIEGRKTLLQEELSNQFSRLQAKLDQIREKRRALLIGLLPENTDNDVQNSESAGILHMGNGHHQNGFQVGRETLNVLASFDVGSLDQTDPCEMDFLGEYRMLYKLSEGQFGNGGGVMYDREGRLIRSPFGFGVPAGAMWNPGSGDAMNLTGDSGFNMFETPSCHRGASLSSSGIFSSTPFTPTFPDNSFASSSAFGAARMQMSPFLSPEQSVFTFSDSRSTGGLGSFSSQSQHSPPQSIPEYPYQNNSYSGVPRALQGVPEGNGIEAGDSSAAANLLNPANLNKLLNLADRFQRVGLNDGNGRNPFGNGNGGVRRTNSNPPRRRSRRASCPEGNGNRGWGPMYQGPRNGNYEENDNVFAEVGENGFLPEEVTGRPGRNMHELEIRCRFGEVGCSEGQMTAPHGFCLGAKTRTGGQEIIVADTNNHRIEFFDDEGRFLWQFGRSGKQSGQLCHPRKVAFFAETNKLVVCDRGSERSRLQIFGLADRRAKFERAIILDYVAIVAGLTTFRNLIVVVDSVNPSCIVMNQSGEIRFSFPCKQDMKEPSDVVVANNLFYICDFKGHSVCTYDGTGAFVAKIGDKNHISFPNGIDVTPEGHVLVGDSHGNRFHVAMYDANGTFLADYECPHMKVSRCCGLVLTPQGHIVTIAKNNNFVLILERLDREIQGFSDGDHSASEYQNQVSY
ncbi:hypothetical protein RvY_13771 [Ramazzottius varieornatus]|uniref:B-box C-terminal domain-containing protein n=1 Tax=Ramazzottius varieornatus TaxID=947166 RepID=A0A1D1VXJ1_RAMVA|nr:hypothetical protein RvY_13771 [Ramazzottius varieornatus]